MNKDQFKGSWKEMNYPAASCGVSKAQHVKASKSSHPRMFLSGVQIRIRLDSRLKHAGMTDFALAICSMQQAAANEPSANQDSKRLV